MASVASSYPREGRRMAMLWTQRQNMGPSARWAHALAHDTQDGRTVLFGGEGAGGSLLADTWAWDGSRWTQVEDIGPAAWAGHTLTTDIGRDRIVLFGGRTDVPLADTWEWDGRAWTQVQDVGPPPRTSHAMAYDSGRSRVVLFGGAVGDGTAWGDTWEWDGDAWTQVADTGPSPRAGHAMSFVGGGAHTVLFGGSTTADTWAWDGAIWTQLNDVGPTPSIGAAMTSQGDKAILFGGADPLDSMSRFGSTWELDGSVWTERQDIGPSPRQGHAMSYDTEREVAVLFGGSRAPSAAGEDFFSDTWELPVARGSGDGTGSGDGSLVSEMRVSPGIVTRGDSITVWVRLDRVTDRKVSLVVTVGRRGEAPSAAIDFSVPPGWDWYEGPRRAGGDPGQYEVRIQGTAFVAPLTVNAW